VVHSFLDRGLSSKGNVRFISRKRATILRTAISVSLSFLPDWVAASRALSEYWTTSRTAARPSSGLLSEYNWSAALTWRGDSVYKCGRSSNFDDSARAMSSQSLFLARESSQRTGNKYRENDDP